MEDKLFKEIIKELNEIHKEFPDMRFGLVVQNAMDEDKNLSNVNLNDRSSKQILTAVKHYKDKNKVKRGKII